MLGDDLARESLDAVDEPARAVERSRNPHRRERPAVHDPGDFDLRPPDVDAEEAGAVVHGPFCPGAALQCKEALPGCSARKPRVDRRLAQRNLRTGLIAGAIAILLFGSAFIAAAIYLG
jgi:hypothetical protein